MAFIRSNIVPSKRPPFALVLFALFVVCQPLLTGPTASACPFCTAVKQTFTEEMESMDVVVIAQLVRPAQIPANNRSGQANQEVAKALFTVLEVIKGGAQIEAKAQIETLYFGDEDKESAFLVMGVDPPNLIWSTPLKLSERAKDYVIALPKLPKEGADRLAFFQDFLTDEDPILAGDAYDEFARAPYADVKALKSKMDHDQLVAWIKASDTTASRRRLYLTMLGVCGGKADLPLLETMIKSDDPVDKSGLDALIACYLTLNGEAGMPLIEDIFLKNEKADYADTYAAIMAHSISRN